MVEAVKPFLSNTLVKEGLQKIAKHFASTSHFGPKSVADFEGLTDTEERELLQRDSFERVSYFLRSLGFLD
jgi:hypothetical protein